MNEVWKKPPISLEAYQAMVGKEVGVSSWHLVDQQRIDIYADVLAGRRMCLCGMLAAEYETLPAPMADAIIRFFDANQAWLTGVLDDGRADGTLSFTGDAGEAAQAVIGTLEGAMLIARPYHDLSRFHAAARRLLEGLT